MGFVKTLLVGRPDGLRSRLRNTFGGAPPTAAPAASPAVVPAEKALRLHKEAPKDVTPPEGFEVVLHREALAPGSIIEVIIGGKAIAVANVGGAFHAISNACAHAEGPLGEGSLEGSVVSCPYHGWQYDVRDGSCLTNPNVKVASFPVQVVGDAVCVRT